MRGQFVFRPPAPIGDPIKDQQKKIQDLEDSIEAYENLLKNPSVHNAEQLEDLLEEARDQVEQARRELQRLGGANSDETSGATPAQGGKRVLPPRGRPKIAPPRFSDEESEQGGNVPPEEEEGEKESPKRSRPPEPQLPQIPEKRIHLSKETEMLNQWTRELNSIVSRALAPLMRTLGIVAARLRYDDVRPLLRWKQDAPLVEDRLNLIESAESVEEFVSKNSVVVGTQLLRLYIASYKPPKEEKEDFARSEAMIGAQSCFDLDLDDPAAVSNWAYTDRRQAALSYLNMSQTEVQFAPAWAFEVMGSGIFRGVLSIACLGAFEAAAAQIRRIPNCATFTMKELICSPNVSDQFAFLVSSVFLSSGDETSVSNKGSQWSRNSTYLNITRMREQLGLSIYTCKIWFESVFAVPNPMLRVFQEKKRERLLKFQEELTVERFIDYMVGEVKNATPAKANIIFSDLVFERNILLWETDALTDELLKFLDTMRDSTSTNSVKEAAQEALTEMYRVRLKEIFSSYEQRNRTFQLSMTPANVQERYNQLLARMKNKRMDTRILEEAFPENDAGRFAIVYKLNLDLFYKQELNDWFQRSKQEASVAFEEKLNLYGNMLPKRELIYRG